MKTILLFAATIFWIPAAGAQVLPDPPLPAQQSSSSCAVGSPGSWSYLSPIVKDSCGHVDKFATAFTAGSGLETITDVGSTVFYLRNKRYVASGAHEANPVLHALFQHEPAAYVFTAVSIFGQNAAANFTARHLPTANGWAHKAQSIALFGIKGYIILKNLHDYRSFEKRYGQ